LDESGNFTGIAEIFDKPNMPWWFVRVPDELCASLEIFAERGQGNPAFHKMPPRQLADDDFTISVYYTVYFFCLQALAGIHAYPLNSNHGQNILGGNLIFYVNRF
jgi:hypothetical protein